MLYSGLKQMLAWLNVFSVACSKCTACYSIRSSHQITTSDGKKRWAINMAAVLSQMLYWWLTFQIEQHSFYHGLFLECNKKVYTRTENFLGEMMKARLAEEMSQAAKQEREHAIETNDYRQGSVANRCFWILPLRRPLTNWTRRA